MTEMEIPGNSGAILLISRWNGGGRPQIGPRLARAVVSYTVDVLPSGV